MFAPTKFNTRIFDEITDTDNNILISAVAGAGKTTTILEALKIIPKNRTSIFCCFNRDIMKELRERAPAYVDVSTIHGIGARAMFSSYGSTFSENKSFTTCLKQFSAWKEIYQIRESKYIYCYMINRLVDLMRLTLTTDPDKVMELSDEYGLFADENDVKNAIKAFNIVYKDTERIDFCDMVFQTAVRDVRLPRYDFVFVDEVQDLNKAQQAIIKKIIMPRRGRLIAVGDPHQAIYGFAGADHDSYNRMRTLMPNTVELPLSISFRCPKKVVAKAQTIVKHIECNPNQIEGTDRNDGKIEEIMAGDWVVCRNVYPLVLVFRYLIRRGKKANIRGRDIGANIIRLIEKTKKSTIEGCNQMIDVFIIQLRSKLLRKGFARPHEHPKMIDLIEKKAIINIFAERSYTLDQLKKNIESIFLDNKTKGITLSTIHRAKGMEADRIFFLCPDLIPSKYATTPKELTQESNLLYVGYTRSKRDLIFVNTSVQDLEKLTES